MVAAAGVWFASKVDRVVLSVQVPTNGSSMASSWPDIATCAVIRSPEGSTKIRRRHPMTGDVYAFGPYSLDVEERRLSHAGEIVPLAPKAFDVLVALVRRAGTLVTKRELLDQVWRDVSVEEGVLSVYVSTLRKSLGESAEGIAYIETVPRAGYRFSAGVTRHKTVAEPPSMKWPIGVFPTRPEVSELIGRGRGCLMAASRAEVPNAVEAFRAAIALDPDR